VSTIGPELENHAVEMAKDDQSGSFFLEHVGNWMAEYMAEAVEKRISQGIIKAGFISKKRYSVGYGDWHVEAQKEILEITEARRIGVSISESYLMIPRKSVSALIGWERK
jgi:cobalamin-dependent methionine synthase I